MSKITNVLYGHKGNIVVYTDKAVIQEYNEPHITISLNKLQTYIENLGIHSTSNGAIKIGSWEPNEA